MQTSHIAIKAAARRTGLSAHVIRIWEKRYGAVAPERTDTNRRLYSEEQIERLMLLRDLRQAGHGLGEVARLPTSALRKLAGGTPGAHGRSERATAETPVPSPYLAECLAAVQRLDARQLEASLKRAGTALGAQGLLQRVVAPLAQAIGDLWREGHITAAHEHFASAVIRVILGRAAQSFAGPGNAPVLVVVTPAGQLHELGALLVGATAANLGWRVNYLGASLPAAEIAGAAKQNRARAVAVSLVYPEDDVGLENELTQLRELLPPDVKLLAGGRAMPAYHAVLKRIGATETKDLASLGAILDDLRKPAKKARGSEKS
jgi:DNA-binding transcriptional MerR regulator/methylmalonyl-CoA mutase cobalamin-binding subunit